jgi:hypothetical protein
MSMLFLACGMGCRRGQRSAGGAVPGPEGHLQGLLIFGKFAKNIETP